MIRETIIHMFATAMALACSGMVLASTPEFVAPHFNTVQVGKALTVAGEMTVGSYPLPVPVMPPAYGSVAVLGKLTRTLFEIQPNDALRPVTSLMLRDGGLNVNLVKLAEVLAPGTKVQITGVYMHFFPALAPTAAKIIARPRYTTDAVQVSKLMIGGQNIVAPTAAEAKRITKVASQRLLRYIRELNPHMADGPEPVIDSVEVLTNDHAVIDLHFVSGWTHQPIDGMTAKVLVVLSGDDEIRVLSGRL